MIELLKRLLSMGVQYMKFETDLSSAIIELFFAQSAFCCKWSFDEFS